MESDEAYAWCCESVMAPVKEAQEAVNQVVDDFVRFIFSGATAQEIKRSYAERDLEARLKEIPALEPLLSKLQTEVQRLMRMHSVRNAK